MPNTMYEPTDKDTVLKREPVDNQTVALPKELVSLDMDSVSALQKVEDLQLWVCKLKSDIELVTDRIEHNVEMFRIMLSDKLKLILNMLSDKRLLMEMTLEDCYQVIGDLVEVFLNIGYDSENDITNLLMKVENLEQEMKRISEFIRHNEFDCDFDKPLWFINHENKLIMRKDVSVGSVLPKFKRGDVSEREHFLTYMMQVFSYYKVPENAWVGLTAGQLIESARDWWCCNGHSHLISWPQFTEIFLNAQFEKDVQFTDNVKCTDYKDMVLGTIRYEENASSAMTINIHENNYINKAEKTSGTNISLLKLNPEIVDHHCKDISIYSNDNEQNYSNECNND